jgi:hypothetical protein
MKKILRALSSVPSLLTAGTAGLLAVTFHSWPIAALGIAACAALAATEANRSKSSLPSVSDPQTANALRAIREARTRIESAITDGDAVATILASAFDLESRAAKLALRAQEIADYLKKTDVAGLQRHVDELAARTRTTTDAKTRVSYDAALHARADHLETVHELLRTKERIAATLLSIAATLDALPAKIVRLRGIDDASNDVGRDLHQMNEEIASFEETLLHIHGVN